MAKTPTCKLRMSVDSLILRHRHKVTAPNQFIRIREDGKLRYSMRYRLVKFFSPIPALNGLMNRWLFSLHAFPQTILSEVRGTQQQGYEDKLISVTREKLEGASSLVSNETSRIIAFHTH